MRPAGETETGGAEGLTEDQNPRGSARLRAEDRIDEILSHLAVGEAMGNKGVGASGEWELEEELLDELAGLERSLSQGVGRGGSRTRTATGGRARWTEGAGV